MYSLPPPPPLSAPATCPFIGRRHNTKIYSFGTMAIAVMPSTGIRINASELEQ